MIPLEAIRLFITPSQASDGVCHYFLERVRQEILNLANRSDFPRELEQPVLVPVVIDLLNEYIKEKETGGTGDMEVTSIKEGDYTVSFGAVGAAVSAASGVRIQAKLDNYRAQIYRFRKLFR